MIPTPEAAVQIPDYDLLYPSILKQRKGYIRHTGTIEDLQFMQSKYTADQEDIKYLNCSNTSEKLKIFEYVIECFEDGANKFSEGIVSVESSLDRIRNDVKLNDILEKETKESELESWLIYWRRKRKLNEKNLVPSLKFEDVGKIGADPYVCFRRRELKQPRKTRRSDAQVMEKIKKINYDLDTMKVMLNAGIKRDKLKMESFLLETLSFEKYWTLRTWQQEFGIERPPTLPSFKAFHQQVPHFPGPEDLITTAKKINKGTLSNLKKRTSRKIETTTSSEAESEYDENEDENNINSVADLVKISIPPAAIKSVKYSRPYYPFEVVKQIQKDVEGLLNPTATTTTIEENGQKFRDFTADLGSIERGADWLLKESKEKFQNFKTNFAQKLEMIQNRHAKDENIILVLRKGRCGRFVYNSSERESGISPVLNKSEKLLKERIFYPTAINHLRSIQARDCAHLNNAFVGNYNQHYIQCTANLAQPTSLPSWIAATSGLLNNSSNNNSNNNNNSKNPTKGSSSPNKKKRTISVSAGEEEGEEVVVATEDDKEKRGEKEIKNKKTKIISSNTNTSTESTVSNLTASPQFTVKVKSKIDPSQPIPTPTPSSLQMESGNDSDGELEVQIPLKKGANAARFTPTGLQKESIK